jgi:hypothetical protein
VKILAIASALLPSGRQLCLIEFTHLMASLVERAMTSGVAKGCDIEHCLPQGAESARCRCTGDAKHQGDRGQCQHVLAVQISLETTE